MKKLLFIHNKLVCGGAESALFSLLCLLDKTKYDITVFVLHDGGEWEQKFRDAGIRVVHSYSRLVPGRRVGNFLLRKKVEKARKSRGKDLIRTALGGEHFDLVIAYHVTAAFMQVGLELEAAKIRYIHGDARQDAVLGNNLRASADHLGRYDRFICVSHWARQAFSDVTGITEAISVCYNPIDSDKVLAGAAAPISEALPEKYICAVGRLSEEKGFARLIRIHKALCDEGLEHGLVIVGDGPERENLEALVCQLGAEDSVTLTGYRENPYGYINGSAFTVCSSYAEGLSMIALESLCLGVPVVSAFPTVAELFGDAKCGIITENDDESLKVGIRKMLTDTAFYEEAVRQAQRRSTAFTASAMVAEAEKIYDAVMEGEKR